MGMAGIVALNEIVATVRAATERARAAKGTHMTMII